MVQCRCRGRGEGVMVQCRCRGRGCVCDGTVEVWKEREGCDVTVEGEGRV